jgi:hypothetical protein
MSKFLSRDEILALASAIPETVEVKTPEWGADTAVRVRGLTAKERDEYEQSLISLRGRKGARGAQNTATLNISGARAKLAQLGCVDESGKQLFTRDDIIELNKLSAAPVDRISAMVQKLSGLSDDDVQEMTENFT